MTPADVPAYPNRVPIYDEGTIRTFFLQFETDDWEQELITFFNTDVEVPATLIVDGRTYRDIGVHFRGNSSFRMVPVGYKHSINLTIDWVNDKQDVGSYNSFNLLNANNDPAFVRTTLYGAIARNYIPIAKTNYVRVVINGENWGIYVSSQQVDKDFLEENFKTRDGYRWRVPGSPRGRGGLEYLGDSVDAYRRIFEVKGDEDPEAWQALIDLAKVLNQTPLDQLEAALAPILDIDGVLRFLALDVALVNSDGYWTRASDYNLYLDPNGRFHVIPHDFNEGLSGGGRGGGFGPGGGGPNLDPLVGLNDPSKPLRSRLLAVPALRERYLDYVRDIAQKHLSWLVLGPIAERYQALIAADVKIDTRKLYSYEEFQTGMASLRRFVEQRRAYLLNYVAR
jgi:spore coat protein CotH